METNTNTTTATSIAPPAKAAVRKLIRKVTPSTNGSKPVSAAKANAAVLKALCGKLGVETRVARRRLRAAKLSFHVLRERWVFTPAQQAAVNAIITGDAPKAKAPAKGK